MEATFCRPAKIILWQVLHFHLVFAMQTALRCWIALHFHSSQKQLHSSLHNSIISHIQQHKPGALLVSSSSSTDGGSAADTHSSQLWIIKIYFIPEMK